ncbi:MAG: cytochrome c-type biogenesis protein CcmH [Deltaproteobacteria bacterium]|nr:cytochrome c-type biogenesis protein CcmH [Deltaproteobacteria bacterium]
MKWLIPILTVFFLISCGLHSADQKSVDTRVETLGHQIRCPICRGVSIADSPSTLATEMMQILRTQIEQGKSDEEVLKYFEERYGPWILLQPKAEGMNLLVWLLPLFFVGGGGVFIILRAKQEKKRAP